MSTQFLPWNPFITRLRAAGWGPPRRCGGGGPPQTPGTPCGASSGPVPRCLPRCSTVISTCSIYGSPTCACTTPAPGGAAAGTPSSRAASPTSYSCITSPYPHLATRGLPPGGNLAALAPPACSSLVRSVQSGAGRVLSRRYSGGVPRPGVRCWSPRGGAGRGAGTWCTWSRAPGPPT